MKFPIPYRVDNCDLIKSDYHLPLDGWIPHKLGVLGPTNQIVKDLNSDNKEFLQQLQSGLKSEDVLWVKEKQLVWN